MNYENTENICKGKKWLREFFHKWSGMWSCFGQGLVMDVSRSRSQWSQWSWIFISYFCSLKKGKERWKKEVKTETFFLHIVQASESHDHMTTVTKTQIMEI